SSRHGLSCSRHLSRSQAETPLIPAVQIFRASSLDPALDWQETLLGKFLGYLRRRLSGSVSMPCPPLRLVLFVPRRVWVSAGRHGIGVAPAAITPLNANLTSAKITHRLLGRLFGL